MPRVALDLNNPADRTQVNGQWRVAPGLVPGEPNEGLTAQILATPARLSDYDDSGWEVCDNIRQSPSIGFTFAWYRIRVELPESVNGMPVAGARLWFETNVDNYGEVWVNGEIDRNTGTIPRPQRPAPGGAGDHSRTRGNLRHSGTGCQRPAGGAAWRYLPPLRLPVLRGY